jgi:hypothetical protein
MAAVSAEDVAVPGDDGRLLQPILPDTLREGLDVRVIGADGPID